LDWSDKRNCIRLLEFPGGIPLIVNMMREDIISMRILLGLRLLKRVKMMIQTITNIQIVAKTKLDSAVLKRIGIVIVIWVTKGICLVCLQID